MKQPTDWNKFFANHPKVRRSTKPKRRPLKGGSTNTASVRLRTLPKDEQQPQFTFPVSVVRQANKEFSNV